VDRLYYHFQRDWSFINHSVNIHFTCACLLDIMALCVGVRGFGNLLVLDCGLATEKYCQVAAKDAFGH
jgi:hypothetical protein